MLLVQISNKIRGKTSYLNKNVKIRLMQTAYFYFFYQNKKYGCCLFLLFILH